MSVIPPKVLKYYKTIEELETVRETLRKAIEVMGGNESNHFGLSLDSPHSPSITRLRLSMMGVDIEIGRRGQEPFEETQKEIPSKDQKRVARLMKEIENLTNELDHERTNSDKSNKIIDWLSGTNGSFYKSDVDDNE
ncbi:MAG: hypothetical protein ACREA7_09220 [Nitrosotalea sp.]